MASAIASIPILTGEVSEKFDTQAKKTYNEYLKRMSDKKNKDNHYEQGIQMVRNILAKSELKEI